MRWLTYSSTTLLVYAFRVAADCQSWGYDFVHEGGPYCINTTDTDFFSFGTIFEGDQMSIAAHSYLLY